TVPRDLETICLKCLRKEPARRYATAGALADDLRCMLEGKPIAARPVSAWGRILLWARRRPAVAALAVLRLLASLGGFAGVVAAGRTAARARDDLVEAQVKEKEARANEQDALGRQRIVTAYHEWLADNAQAAGNLLREAADRQGTWEWRYVNRLC